MAGKRKVYGYLRLIPREQFTKKTIKKVLLQVKKKGMQKTGIRQKFNDKNTYR